MPVQVGPSAFPLVPSFPVFAPRLLQPKAGTLAFSCNSHVERAWILPRALSK
jgi:hypothetical protein